MNKVKIIIYFTDNATQNKHDEPENHLAADIRRLGQPRRCSCIFRSLQDWVTEATRTSTLLTRFQPSFCTAEVRTLVVCF